MRHAFLILILCLSKGFSQVGPPDLRCLAVSANGNVTLTWIAPADPGNNFSAYEIFYSSTGAAGSFASIVTLTGSIFTTTYTHVGTTANSQSAYYFIRSKYGPGGSILSGNSDTLKTIFVNILLIPDAINIVYNSLHLPKLPSSNAIVTVLKEYPLGTWDTLGLSTGQTYPDTLSVCQASINYQVTQLDNSGCMSISNIQRGVYFDRKNPNEPVIDSVSVLPNGDVVVSWSIPRDLDIIKYAIYQVVNSATLNSNIPIDTVYGRNNTSYIFSPSGSGTNTVGLTVAAVDSCGRPGTFTSLPSTMFLKASYNSCNYRTDLSWNPYPNMRNGVKEYRVYCSVDGGPFSQIGVTGGTGFTHSNVTPGKNLCYYVRVFNTNLNITSSSNRSCIFSREVDIPAFVYMKTASVTSLKSTQLRLFLDTSKACKGIDIFRSTDGISYESAGFVATSKTTPHYSFADTDIEPGNTSYYYKAVIKDSCGNARTTSNVSKTVLLTVTDDKEFIFTKHLSWSDYLGFAGGTSGYNIYRVINGEATPQPVSTTGIFITSYTDNLEDEAPSGSKIDYVVEAVEGIGNPYVFRETSLSNTRPVYMDDRIFIPTAFAPNGINKTWLPVTHFVDKLEYHLLIYSRWGNKVFETADDTEGWKGHDAEPGIYAYMISYKNSRGEYKELTGTLMLYK